MPKDYQTRTKAIQTRINPENFSLNESFRNELTSISYSNVLTYIRMAMKGADPAYTEKSVEAGQKVKNHLSDGLEDVSYAYQGSVMTNTHIVGNSDIDLLVICEKFYTINHNRIEKILNDYNEQLHYEARAIEKLRAEVEIPFYTGNALQDLANVRYGSELILKNIYEECDIKQPKAITINNKSLKRFVDIVVASWYDDILSIVNNRGDYRGIQIYNKAEHNYENPDYPFLSIKRINEKGNRTNGRLKKMIRFLKNVKADSDYEIALSSFDVNAICYAIDEQAYAEKAFYQLVPLLYQHLVRISRDRFYADTITSVDGREYIFKGQNEKHAHLQMLMLEVTSITSDLANTFIV
jgi:predicted nucleotidyltransferase